MHISICVILGLLLSAAYAPGATTSAVSRIKPQEITTIEIADTVLDRDELVYCRDEANIAGTIALRIGDGATPGGALVSDAFALRTSFLRPLRRDEYQIMTYGNVTYSNAAWQMLTRRTASSMNLSNTGALVISSAYPIAQVLGSQSGSDSCVLMGDELNVRNFSIKTNYTIWANEIYDAPPETTIPYYLSISNMTVWAWVGSSYIGVTNDVRASDILVADPAADASAISRGWFLSAMAGHRGDDWSAYAATTPVDAAWQPIRHNPYLSCISSGNAGNLVWQRRYASGITRDLMTLSSTNRTYGMTATYTGTNIEVLVDASCPFAAMPIIQACTNLISGNWTNLTTVSTWPTTTWSRAASGALRHPTFTLTAPIDTSTPVFFRVVGTSTNTDLDALTLSVPITLLPNNATNAPASGVTLYVDQITGKLWAVTATTNRVCLTP
jgi:hypothetical protein